MKNYAIILASGTGSRANLEIPKQFYKINGKTILDYSLEAFQIHSKIDLISVVANGDFIDLTKKIASKYSKVTNVVKGGVTRQESSYNGVKSIIADANENILIHDAVRPFVTSDIIDNCILALQNYSAVNVVQKVSDTIVEIDENNIIKNVPVRDNLRRCQTPQCFKYSVIKKAHELALKEKYNSATDDCSLILRYNLSPVAVVEGSERNIKITYPSDILIAEEMIKTYI